MRRVSVIGLLLGVLYSLSFGQQNPGDAPATRDDVEKYMQVMHSRDVIEQTIQAFSAPMKKMMHDEFVKNQDKLPQDFEAEMSRLIDDMVKNAPWEEMLQAMAAVYEKHFSRNDLQALTAFYSTPTGQKILREMPAANIEAMQNAMPVMRNYIETVQQALQARIQDADKAGRKNSPAKN